MTTIARIAAALQLLFVLGFPLSAQQPDSSIIEITVQEPMGPVPGALVRSGTTSTTTDSDGRARLTLRAGAHTLRITREGYVPKSVKVTLIANRTTSLTIDVEMTEGGHDMHEMEELVVTATRTECLAGDSPVRVEVLDEMEVDENTLMAPSGITMLLNETPGLRVQAASPTLGTGSVRILGLSGQYTAMLGDGLPIYGGAASALGPLDISPVDLARVELIKGAASALYGGQALGGVINLISKQPTGRKELLLNRRTMGVTDAATWLSHRFSGDAGASLLVSGTMQDAHDVDDDDWNDQPRARRWGIRPRYSSHNDNGRALFLTAGYAYDDRQGGGLAFREGLMSNRVDAGATLRLPRSDSAHFALRLAASRNARERTFGHGPIEEDRITTGFAELTHMRKASRGSYVLGAAVQLDAYANELNGVFDHDWVTPGVFVTADRDLGPVTLSASVRGDAHPEEGLQLTERLAILLRPAPEWTVRLGGGTGFAAPAPLTEEVEAIGLRAIQRSELRGERSVGVMVDVSGRIRDVELLLTGYGSFIDGAIQLVDRNDAARTGVLRNAAGETRIAGAEAAAVWRFSPGGKLLLTYGYAQGTRTDAETGVREDVPLLVRQRAGADLMLEKPNVYRVGIEGIYYGRQVLDENPYRTHSKPYVYMMAIAMRQFGPLEVVANFENLLDVRQTKYDSLLLPTPDVGGRRTTDVWAPLEGFMANVALRYRWSR
jgi:outer membrane receptor for ferrienterochelin and colicins